MSRKKTINNIVNRNYVERGNRLEQWWKTKGWTKLEFARRMKIWPQNVNKYFSGQLDPMSLAQELYDEGCDLIWILTGRSRQSAEQSAVAESVEEYRSKDPLENLSKQSKERIEKLIKLLETDSSKSVIDMLDAVIKNIEDKQKRKK